MLDSISLKSVIDLADSSTSLCYTEFGKNSKKRGGGKRVCGCASSSLSHFHEGKEAKERQGKKTLCASCQSLFPHSLWLGDSVRFTERLYRVSNIVARRMETFSHFKSASP